MPLIQLPAAMDLWLPSYVRQTARRWAGQPRGEVHMLLCIADHFEPYLGGASQAVADARLARWVQDYPQLFGQFRDTDGRPPRHSFFYPIEDYRPDVLDPLADLCRGGFGEIEIHLHHDRDTAESLRRTLTEAKEILAKRHGQLAHDRQTGEIRYGFIHGNWALDNSHPNGCACGVNNELNILRETGCYADFTMPSAPNRAQTRTINSIYYSVDDPLRPKSHDSGTPVGIGPRPANSLMLFQGPLLFNWFSRKWGIVPRVENGCLQGSQPPTARRIDLWLRARVQVPTRPDWFFVKLHSHGANEMNQSVMLGEPMMDLHRELARRSARNPLFHYHYVTAREMYNLACAAEAGWKGSVDEARDFELIWNSCQTCPHEHPNQ